MDCRSNSVVVFRSSGGVEAERAETADEDYLRRRERAERAAAKRASNPQVRRIHQDLAQAYAGARSLLRGA